MIFLYYCWVDHKRFFRYWQNVFFIYAYPLLLVGMFGTIFSQRNEAGSSAYLDYALPGYLAIIVLSALFLGVFGEFLNWRSNGAVQSFSRTPLTFGVMTSLTASTHIIHALLAQLLTLAFAHLAFGLTLPPLLPFMTAQTLLVLSVYSMGYFFHLLFIHPQLNSVVRFALFFLTMFLSGAAIPIELFPPVLRRIAQFFPLNYGIDILKPLWGSPSERSRNSNILFLSFFSCLFLLLSWFVRVGRRKKNQRSRKRDR